MLKVLDNSKMETKQPLRDLQNVTKPMTAAPLAKTEGKLDNERTKPKYFASLFSLILFSLIKIKTYSGNLYNEK